MGKLRHRRLNKGDFVFSSYEKTTPKSRIFKKELDDFENKMEKMMRKVFEEERLREEGKRENLKEERLRKERGLVERERKLEGATARGLTVYGTKYQLENDPHGDRIDDPLTPQDERYDCGDPGNCYFDHNTFTEVYE